MGFLTRKRQPVGGESTQHESYQQRRMGEVLAEFHIAEAELGDAARAVAAHNSLKPDLRLALLNGETYVRMGAMFLDPTLRELESCRTRALARRNALLGELASLRMALRLCK